MDSFDSADAEDGSSTPGLPQSRATARFLNGEYLVRNPTWHAEDSAWKASQIHKMLVRNGLEPRSIADVGCGAGEVLCSLADRLGAVRLVGFEVSRAAFEICSGRSRPGIEFRLADITAEPQHRFDVVLLIDVLEHVEDYFEMLRSLKQHSRYKIIHLPLELAAMSMLRPHVLLRSRADTGHIHYFNREVALAAVRDAGYTIVDWFYTAGVLELPPHGLARRMAAFPRRVLRAISEDWAARLMTGFSIMILAE
jgi:SAM-dependent methyltransferase